MGKKDKNNDYHKRVRPLFWAAVIATLSHLFLLTLDAMGRGTVSFQMTMFYVSILGTYSGQNALVRLKDSSQRKSGHIFVYVIWAYCISINILSVWLNKPDWIPGQLNLTWQIVTALFFGTSVPRILQELGFMSPKKFKS
jgi:hypothetical protein